MPKNFINYFSVVVVLSLSIALSAQELSVVRLTNEQLELGWKKGVGGYTLETLWFGSGTPTYLINMLKKFGVEPSEIGNNRVSVEDFDAPTERMTSIIPLLYQSGYITIKNYDEELDLYTLNIPNKEVRIGLMKSLLPHYVGSKAPETTTMVAYLSRDIRNGDMDTALRRLQTFLSTIPQCDNTKYEGRTR